MREEQRGSACGEHGTEPAAGQLLSPEDSGASRASQSFPTTYMLETLSIANVRPAHDHVNPSY